MFILLFCWLRHRLFLKGGIFEIVGCRRVGLCNSPALGWTQDHVGKSDDAVSKKSDLWIYWAHGGCASGEAGARVSFGGVGGISWFGGECADASGSCGLGKTAVGEGEELLGVGNSSSAEGGCFLGYGLLAFGLERGCRCRTV